MTAPGLLVGKHRIDVAVAQAGLVQAQVRSDVFREKYIFLSVTQLRPLPVIAYGLLVLFAQSLPVQAIAPGQCGDAYWGGLNLPLLKKPRTRR